MVIIVKNIIIKNNSHTCLKLKEKVLMSLSNAMSEKISNVFFTYFYFFTRVKARSMNA